MSAYCDRQSVDLNAIAFLFDGRRLRGDQTPDEVIIFFLCLNTDHYFMLSDTFFFILWTSLLWCLIYIFIYI